MIFGYARVSTNEQNLDLQIDSFLRQGIKDKNIYTDKVSSTKEERKKIIDFYNMISSAQRFKNAYNRFTIVLVFQASLVT